MYRDIVQQYDPNGELALLITFSKSPEDAISKLKIRDINIIFGFFGEKNARTVLCKVNVLTMQWLLSIVYIGHTYIC